ncbi:MAG: hypothetical protein H7A34_03010 [bacterium]|nr:hypothetical protein [bacterium]
MEKLIKYGVFLGFALAVLSVATSLMLAVKEMKNQKVSAGNEEQLNKMANMQKTLRDKIKEHDAIVAEKTELQNTVNAVTKDLKTAQKELDELNTVLLQKQEELEKIRLENQTAVDSESGEETQGLYAKLESAQKKTSEIEEKFKNIDDAKKQLQVRLDELENSLQAKETELLQAKQRESDLLTSVNELKTKVSELSDYRNQNFNSGRKSEAPIEVVNREMKFIVFGIGQNDGLTEGEILKVYRSNKYLGTVQVDEVFQNMAAATVNDEVLSRNISEGDVVKR